MNLNHFTLQGRAKASDEGGVSIKSGGVSAAAAIDAKEKALSKQGNTSFYRFHQRDKRRAGENESVVSLAL